MVFWDEELEGVNGVLEAVLEHLCRPVVSAGLFFVDDVDEDFQFALVSVVFECLDYLWFWYELVLDAQSRLDTSVHLLAHQVELLDHGHQFYQLFLQEPFLFLYQKVSQLFGILDFFGQLQTILSDDVLVLAHDGFDLELLLNHLLLFFELLLDLQLLFLVLVVDLTDLSFEGWDSAEFFQ